MEPMAEILSKIISLETTVLGRMSALEENMSLLTEKVNESITSSTNTHKSNVPLPSSLTKSKSLLSSVFDKVNSDESKNESEQTKSTAPKGDWIKLFCHKRGTSFLFNIRTRKVPFLSFLFWSILILSFLLYQHHYSQNVY